MVENPSENLLIDPNILKSKKTEQPAVAEAPAKKANRDGYYSGVGRRKTAIARVRIKLGEGKIQINKKKLDEYFHLTEDRNAVVAPLKAVKCEGKFDILANVKGGGPTGQAGAILLGVARALKSYDPDFLPALRDGGYLTRDSRMKERKKYGQRGARRRFQFSKR